MKVEVIKAFSYKGINYVRGQKMQVWPTLGEDWIKERKVREYDGNLNKKTNSNIFNPVK